MSDKDANIIEDLLKYCADNKASGRCMQCLEWGAGGSTVYFPELLEAMAIYRWLSLEHDLEWFEKVLKETQVRELHTHLVLFPENDPHKQPMEQYVNYPFTTHARFDFVLVDGRKRRRCLITASKLLAPGGVVVLHDAEREYYHSAFEHYTAHERVGDKLWIGRVDI